MELAPLRVRITRMPNRRLLYPNFNRLTGVKKSGLRWQDYFDQFNGQGWRIDRRSPIGVSEGGIAVNEQDGVVLLPEEDVDEAVALFPARTQRMAPGQFVNWWNNRHAFEDKNDTDVLLAIIAKYVLQHLVDPAVLDPADVAALNPNNPARGIRSRRWAQWSADKDITLV